MTGIMKAGLSEYEKIRLKNIEDNKKMLESMGLLRSFKPILKPVRRNKTVPNNKTPQTKTPQQSLKRKYVGIEDASEETGTKRRRSLRKMGIEPDGSVILNDDDEEDEDFKPKQKVKRENYFGAPEVPIGTYWEYRIGCNEDGVHRPTVAGISGNENEGCYSIALSGGYEDDIDLGDSFTYTGSGGRDLKGTKANPKEKGTSQDVNVKNQNLRTAPQSKDQTLTKMNLALSRNVESRQPVRVIRGFKCPSEFAPDSGYRYDGLYTVEKCWSAVGLSGFLVWKYILKRVEDQPPPPWIETDVKEPTDNNNNEIVNNENKNNSGDHDKVIDGDDSESNKENIPPQSNENETVENVENVENDDLKAGDNNDDDIKLNDDDHENSSDVITSKTDDSTADYVVGTDDLNGVHGVKAEIMINADDLNGAKAHGNNDVKAEIMINEEDRDENSSDVIESKTDNSTAGSVVETDDGSKVNQDETVSSDLLTNKASDVTGGTVTEDIESIDNDSSISINEKIRTDDEVKVETNILEHEV